LIEGGWAAAGMATAKSRKSRDWRVVIIAVVWGRAMMKPVAENCYRSASE
jgi:hypothetical protein